MSQEPALNREGLPRGLPRWVEAPLALGGLTALCPVMCLCSIVVRFSSNGSVLFRQERVGQGGKRFILYKFRTMRVNDTGPQVTADGDCRITRVGRWLRRLKLDELPQLWNVLRGEMALVGPRPEVPRYVDLASPVWREVLLARPGITDPVTLALRNEEAVFREVTGDRELFYTEALLPIKLAGYRDYLLRRTWRTDIGVLVRTAMELFQKRVDVPSGSLPVNLPELSEVVRLWNLSTPAESHGKPGKI